ncbi:hypothetical protein [Kordia sp.]|uniref:hypothetical protein n=1 Tax=Kordia sp. TaxID=1965332 RepID=UPI003D6BBA39
MRLFVFGVLSLLLFSCSKQKAPTIIKSNSQSSIAFLYCIKFDDGFVVTTENNELYFLNSNFEIDTDLTQKIKPGIPPRFFAIHKGKLLMYDNREEKDGPYMLTSTKEWVVVTDKDFSDVFYEDEDYIVSSQCKGEFGGTIFFEHKKTKKIYSCVASCLTSVNKLNNVYYLTSALGHLGASSKILEIKDPTALIEVKKGTPIKNNWWINKGLTHDDLLKGTEKIIDTFGLLIHDAFIIKNKLYYLNETEISNSSYGMSMGNVLLSVVKDRKLITVDTIHTGSTALGTLQKTNKYSFYLFNYSNKKVFITRSKDTIDVVALNIKKEL